MNVLVVNFATDAKDPLLGFATRWISALATQVDSVHVISMWTGEYDLPDNVTVYSMGKEKGYGKVRRVVELYRILLAILSFARIDVCFVHMFAKATPLVSPVLALRGIPVVTWYAHRHVDWTVKLAYFLSRRIVTSARNSFQYRQGKVVIIGQGIDIDTFAYNGQDGRDPYNILSVGRISPIKDQKTLVRAVAMLRDKGHPFTCRIVGDVGPDHETYDAELRQLVKELGISDVVDFAGPVSNSELVPLLQVCGCHVNCGPANHSLDKVVLEAMSCGAASVTSIVAYKTMMGWAAEYLCFEQGDATCLARVLEQLVVLDKDRMIALQRHLRNVVEREASVKGLVSKLVTVLSAVSRQ